MTKSRGIRPPRKRWTDAELAELARRYPDTDTAELAEHFGVSEVSVYYQASTRGLRKTKAFRAAVLEKTKGILMAASVATQLKKGHTPWNKGLKGINTGDGAGRFKPGVRRGKAALNYKPIGFERVTRYGYIERKINNDLPFAKRWKAVHILNWEAAHGPVPPGHYLTFKDGNRQNVALDNLALISQVDLMHRNNKCNFGPEISQLIALRAAITRQINKRNNRKETQ